MKDVPTKPEKEVFVGRMGRNPPPRGAVTKNVPILSRKEVYVVDMEQISLPEYVVIKDVPTNPEK